MNLTFSRRDFLKTISFGTAVMSMPGGELLSEALHGRPNIIFILIDDLGWKDVGFMGNSYYDTPNIDKLARQSIRNEL